MRKGPLGLKRLCTRSVRIFKWVAAYALRRWTDELIAYGAAEGAVFVMRRRPLISMAIYDFSSQHCNNII